MYDTAIEAVDAYFVELRKLTRAIDGPAVYRLTITQSAGLPKPPGR